MFGCKGPLRHAIIADDAWFPTASNLVHYLSNFFADMEDNSKLLFTIDTKETTAFRLKDRVGHPVKGSSFAHIISLKDKAVSSRTSLDGSNQMFNLNFNDNECNNNESEYDEMEEEENVDNRVMLIL